MTKPRCPVSGQTTLDERINSLTHGLGAILSLAAFFALVISASLTQNVWHIISSTVFGISLILLYIASTLYHSSKNVDLKRKLKVFDHASIYVLIAGTYTPFMLGPLRGPWGWSFFILIWSLAFCGIIFKLFFAHRFKVVSTLLYLGMGWIIVFAFPQLTQVVPAQGIFWMIAGGLFYTLGTIFYLGHRIPFNHGFWHLFVLAGSACHFCSVFFYVLV
jgi:hemolysin III